MGLAGRARPPIRERCWRSSVVARPGGIFGLGQNAMRIMRNIADSSAMWTIVRAPSTTTGEIWDVIAESGTSSRLMIASHPNIPSRMSCIYVTSDRGANWSVCDSGLSLIVAGNAFYDELYRLIQTDSHIVAVGQTTFLSNTFGLSWTESTDPAWDGYPIVLEQHGINKNFLCFGGTSLQGAPKYGYSLDTGRTWRNTHVYGPGLQVGRVTAIGLTDPSPHRVFVAVGERLLYTLDSGATWPEIYSFPRSVIRTIVSVRDTLFVGGDVLSVSPNAGIDWYITDTPFPFPTEIRHIVKNDKADMLFFGTSHGIYRLDLR